MLTSTSGWSVAAGQQPGRSMSSRHKSTNLPDHDAYAALRFVDFRYLISASFLSSFAQAMVSVLVAWLTNSICEFWFGARSALGLVGLVQIVPMCSCRCRPGSLSISMISANVPPRLSA